MIKSQGSEKLRGIIFKVLLIVFFAFIAWQSQLHFISFDWTKNQRNSLSEASIRLVKTLDESIKFSLFASPNNRYIALFNDLLKRYQYQQQLITIEIINPDLSPELLRQYDIEHDGVLIIEFKQKTEKIVNLTERNITNALQRLVRQGERWIVFLEGHGERHPYAGANHDMSVFSAQLASKGFILESLNLSKLPEIPTNTNVLVIASPQTPLLPGEVAIIVEYVHKGGNLLWLTEPNKNHGMAALADLLNVDFLNGVIVDPNSQLLGLKRLDYALVNAYPIHPITQYIASISIFPQALALFNRVDNNAQIHWESRVLLETQANSWNETGEMKGEIRIGDNSDESLGPLILALSLNRTLEHDLSGNDLSGNDPAGNGQRVIVVGDGDFLANQFLGNGANAELGFNMINWLSHDDALIAINAKAAPDTELNLSNLQKIMLALGFLILLPLALLLIGLSIWMTRKNK